MILKSGEDKNPYNVAFHKDDCDETVWASESELLSPEEVASRKCEACRAELALWDKIIRLTAFEVIDGEPTQVVEPVTLYGDLANRGFALRTKVIDFYYPVERLSAFDYYLVEIVHQEAKRREAYQVWKQKQEMGK